MKIAILGPIHKASVSKLLLKGDRADLPDGYFGAPFLGTLIEELLNRGHSVVAITTDSTLPLKSVISFENDRFKWIVVSARRHTIRPHNWRLGKIVDFFQLERNLIRNVLKNESGLEFIHAHWSYEFAGAIKHLKIPYLVTVHDNAYQVLRYMPNLYRLGRLVMSEWVLRGCKYASTVSPYMYEYVAKRCKSVYIIPNPIAVRKSRGQIEQCIEKKISRRTTPLIVMIMNGWSKRKNGGIGLMAFKQIKQLFGDASIHLFGHGTEAGGVGHRFAEEQHLIDGVSFHGAVDQTVLQSYLDRCHILIHPSLEESFGVVLLEAMINGVPVIGGGNSGAVPWVVDNEFLLADVSNADDIFLKAKKLIENPCLYKKLALSCYDNASNRFSIENVASMYESLYHRIIKEIL